MREKESGVGAPKRVEKKYDRRKDERQKGGRSDALGEKIHYIGQESRIAKQR